MKKLYKKAIVYGFASLAALSTSLVFSESVPGTDFNIHFEASNIVGTGRSINMHRVPVVIGSTGETLFFDVSFKLSMDSNKQLIFDGFSQITSPSINNVDNFISGTYQDTVGNKYILSGPSVVSDGRTGWALSTTELTVGGNFTNSWVTGAVSGHPSIGNRTIVTELLNGFAYGVQGTNENNSLDIRGGWRAGSLIGAQQIGDTLVLSRFHEASSFTDSSTPSASINLIRVIQ